MSSSAILVLLAFFSDSHGLWFNLCEITTGDSNHISISQSAVRLILAIPFCFCFVLAILTEVLCLKFVSKHPLRGLVLIDIKAEFWHNKTCSASHPSTCYSPVEVYLTTDAGYFLAIACSSRLP